MPLAPNIGSVMTAFPYTIDRSAHASTARSMLAQLKIHHLPVTEGNVLIGVVTERDLRQAESHGLDVSVKSKVTVAEVCNPDIYVVSPNEPLDQVLTHMADKRIDVTFVLKDGKLSGIFTVVDACRRCAELLRMKESYP